MKKTLKNIGIAISVYAFFYLITSFILWDFDLSVMRPDERFAIVFASTAAIGMIIYFKELLTL